MITFVLLITLNTFNENDNDGSDDDANGDIDIRDNEINK